jgi:adenine phosphoribosyltransferase
MHMSLSDKLRNTIRDVPDYPQPGIIFKDITPVLASPQLVRQIIREMVAMYQPMKLDAVAAVEARGFIFGSILAHELNCRFVPVRKAGKLPYKTRSLEYALEYGTASIEMHTDAVQPGWRVLVHDDLLATGGTASAAAQMVREFDAELTGFSFLVNLSFLPGESILKERFGLSPEYLVSY